MLQRADVAEVLKAEGQRSRRSRFARIAVVIALILLAGGGVGVWFVLRGGTSTAYATTPVTRGDVVVLLTATGTLEPTRQVAVSSLVTGTIVSVDVDFNQEVSAGQVLSRLDLHPFDLKLQRAMAMVDAQVASRDAAAAGVKDASSALQRLGELAHGNLVSIEQLELAASALQRAKANLAAAEAQLRAAEADLAGARDDYDKAIVVAPIDGIILDVNAERGQTINSTALAASLFTIASDIRQLELEVDVDEADVAQVKIGDTARFTVESMPDKPLAGVVRQVHTGPTVSNGITSYKAVIAVANDDLMLRPGMTATADISTAEARDVLRVPNAALRYEPDSAKGSVKLASSIDGQDHVYALRDDKLELIPVVAGLSDGQQTEVTSDGLVIGDLVVTGTQVR